MSLRVRQRPARAGKEATSTITTQQIHVSASGEMAWNHGGYVNELKGPDGRIKEEGEYLGVYHKVTGKWKGAAFCITANG
jgi:hypothetical protein